MVNENECITSKLCGGNCGDTKRREGDSAWKG